jgi:hypothetical protein
MLASPTARRRRTLACLYADLLGLHTYDHRSGRAIFMSVDEDHCERLRDYVFAAARFRCTGVRRFGSAYPDESCDSLVEGHGCVFMKSRATARSRCHRWDH